LPLTEISDIIRSDIQSPVEIASRKPQNQGFRRRDIRRDRDIILIAASGDRVNIGVIRAGRDRIIKEDHHVHAVPYDHIHELLVSADRAGQELVYFEIRHFFDSSPGTACRVQMMPGEDVFIGKAKIFDQCFLVIMRNKSDVHQDIHLSDFQKFPL